MAGEPVPHPNVLPEGEVRERYREALLMEQQARAADEGGKRAEARSAYAAAADSFMGFIAKYPKNNWDEAFRYHAARLYEEAGKFPQAVATAETLAESTQDPMSQALAWLVSANARVKAKDLQPLRIVPLDERKGPPTPREPPSVWASFLDSAGKAIESSGAPGATGGRPAPKRTLTPEQVGLIAAQTAFAYDRLEQARGFLQRVVEGSRGQPEVFAAAVPLYLRTFADAGDMDGYGGALERVRGIAAQGAIAPEPTGSGSTQTPQGQAEAQAGGAKEEAAQDLGKAVDAADFSIRFALARRTLDAGKADEAAKTFEELAKIEGGDPAAALEAAGFALEKAGEMKRSVQLRERVLAEYGDSAAAPNAALALASLRSKMNDHAAAAKAYETYLERWPEGQQRCAVLRNAAIALDQAEKYADAAAGYLRFARDQGCGETSADAKALAFYRAGRLYQHVGKKAEAKEAFREVLGVQGATSPEAQQALADAKKRAK